MKTLLICVFLLLFHLSSVAANAPLAKAQQASASSPCTVYFAAALFSMREKNFNTELSSRLEENYHYKVFLPQRDGFEFSELNGFLAKHLGSTEALKADKIIIYSLDMGYFLLNSDVVVAILDEELDPGVVIEVAYGKLMGKHIIGVRTDVRSPYGPEASAGAHFFPLFQLDDYLFFSSQDDEREQVDKTLDTISRAVGQKIQAYNQNNICGKSVANILQKNPTAQRFQEAARILFHGMTLKQMNTQEGLKIIVDRYVRNKKYLEKLYPSIP